VTTRRLRDTLRRMLDRHAAGETDALLRLPAAIGTPSSGAEAGAMVGAYRLIRELGAGGMGQVWLAERADGNLKRRVALKLPHLSWSHALTERFAREREIMASLEHPHIRAPLRRPASTPTAGHTWRSSTWKASRSTSTAAASAALSVEQCLGVPAAGCRGRGLRSCPAGAAPRPEAGQHPRHHPRDRSRLLDFGVAKLMLGDTVSETALTRESGRALTLDYASPEQIRGEPLGTASDVYSLGVVAFELLAGARPHRLQGQSGRPSSRWCCRARRRRRAVSPPTARSSVALPASSTRSSARP
jgi:serine/threonine-protein kinase